MYKFTESQRINVAQCPIDVARRVRLVADEAAKLGVYNTFDVSWNDATITTLVNRQWPNRCTTYRFEFSRNASSAEIRAIAEKTFGHPLL